VKKNILYFSIIENKTVNTDPSRYICATKEREDPKIYVKKKEKEERLLFMSIVIFIAGHIRVFHGDSLPERYIRKTTEY
jgi:hypothetical protein